MNKMDDVIDHDVAELRSLLNDLPDPSEPHPAYWNNFLVRVHERIEEKHAPKKKAWWSPALIWGSFGGVACLLLAAYLTGVFPFGNTISDSGGEVFADLTGNEQVLTTQPDIDEELDGFIMSGIDNEAEEVSYIMLTQDEVDMMNAIESDDDDAILRAILEEDVSLEI